MSNIDYITLCTQKAMRPYKIVAIRMEPSSTDRIYDTNKFRTKDSENDLM